MTRNEMIRLAVVVTLAAAVPAVAAAHHILGIPHYRYGDDYPQIPFVEVLARVGPHDLTFTYFPGIPQPGERVRCKLYIRNRTSGEPFLEPLQVEVHRRRFLRSSVPAAAPLRIAPGTGPEKNDYKFFFTFEDAEAYEMRVHFPTGDTEEIIPFPVTVGATDDRPLLLGAVGILGAAVLSVALVKRRQRRAGRRKGTLMEHCTMQGLPPAIFHAALGLAGVLTAWSLWRGPDWFRRDAPPPRLDLMHWPALRWLVSRRPFQFSLQLPLVLALFLILAAGFLGSPVAERNIATVLTWTLWWTLLIVDIVLLGRMWCLVCPWEALASWLRRLAFWRRRRDEPLALGLRWPRWLRNVYPATLLFIGLTWLELGFGVTRSPRATAVLGLAMLLLAVIPALVFERRSFCRYGCLIGRICGLYSMLAPVEVRARDLDVCRGCRFRACLTGNGRGYPCPTGQCLPVMQTNTYCTVCTECVKSCPEDNVAINLRPWGADLARLDRPRRDEAILALVMLSLTSFHGLTMTPAWSEALAWLRVTSGARYLPAFSLGMLVVLALPAALFLLFTLVAVRMAGAAGADGRSRQAALWQAGGRYAYPLIAVALMYHLAHNAGHLLTEAGSLLPVLSDPFGSGRNLLGTATMTPGPLASQPVIWAIQIGLVVLGLVWALRATERANRRLAAEWRLDSLPLSARAVAAAFLLMATSANLWLLAQAMEMRTGM